MAIIKHISIKNANYSAAEKYLLYQHDEMTKKPILDDNGDMLLRENYLKGGVNCDPDTFSIECMELNKQYGQNTKPNDVKAHHYILSFDPKDKELGLTLEKAQQLGEKFARENFEGYQCLVVSHEDGHNGSGNIHVHMVINSTRKYEIDRKPYMERESERSAGAKHRCSNKFMADLRTNVMEMTRENGLNQVDLFDGTGKKDKDYWVEKRGKTKNKNFKSQKQKDIEKISRAIVELKVKYENMDEIVKHLDEYGIEYKNSRGALSFKVKGEAGDQHVWHRERALKLGANALSYDKRRILQQDIDTCIMRSKSFEVFKENMVQCGHEFSIRSDGTNCIDGVSFDDLATALNWKHDEENNIKDEYSYNAIQERIAGNIQRRNKSFSYKKPKKKWFAKRWSKQELLAIKARQYGYYCDTGANGSVAIYTKNPYYYKNIFGQWKRYSWIETEIIKACYRDYKVIEEFKQEQRQIEQERFERDMQKADWKEKRIERLENVTQELVNHKITNVKMADERIESLNKQINEKIVEQTTLRKEINGLNWQMKKLEEDKGTTLKSIDISLSIEDKKMRIDDLKEEIKDLKSEIKVLNNDVVPWLNEYREREAHKLIKQEEQKKAVQERRIAREETKIKKAIKHDESSKVAEKPNKRFLGIFKINTKEERQELMRRDKLDKLVNKMMKDEHMQLYFQYHRIFDEEDQKQYCKNKIYKDHPELRSERYKQMIQLEHLEAQKIREEKKAMLEKLESQDYEPQKRVKKTVAKEKTEDTQELKKAIRSFANPKEIKKVTKDKPKEKEYSKLIYKSGSKGRGLYDPKGAFIGSFKGKNLEDLKAMFPKTTITDPYNLLKGKNR